MRALRPPRRLPQLPPHRNLVTDSRPFAAHDKVILRQKLDRSAPLVFTTLQAGKQHSTHRGVIEHDDVIGRRVRDVVSSKYKLRDDGTVRQGVEYRIHEVRLEEYVRFTPRLVTPIYPADASLIVDLLDLHPSPPSSAVDGDEPRLEILEAGTGHGALTLYLARAVHAANPSPSRSPPPSAPPAESISGQPGEGTQDRSPTTPTALPRAVIHSIELNARHSAHAQQTVHAFRHALYSPSVNFHIGDVSAWLQRQTPVRSAFLSAAILDLPTAFPHLAPVSHALRTDAPLLVFAPSITQITTLVAQATQAHLPLELEKVVELGVNGGSGGREWDVRAVRPRAAAAAAAAGDAGDAGDDALAMVCRPKVGDRVVGGGFVGVWRKQRVRERELELDSAGAGAGVA